MNGFYFSFPFNLGSVWIEWRGCPLGFGHDLLDKGDREFFLGRIQGVWSPASSPSRATEAGL